jgi:hypothetical protein
LLKLLATEFPDVTSSDFNHSSQTGFKFGASLNAAAYIAYTFTGGRNQTSVSADSSNFKSFFSETSTSVRSSLPEI